MTDHVVYLLGAGFSAPLGIPVMGNFVSRSRDLLQQEPLKYPHFREVFDLFRDLNAVKGYYRSNLQNIEEVLSILGAGATSTSGLNEKHFVDYICDVIEASTPSVRSYGAVGGYPSNYRGFIFGDNLLHNAYGTFLLALSRRGVTLDQQRSARVVVPPDHNRSYGLITLNYDMVVEGLHRYATKEFGLDVPIETSPDASFDDGESLPLAKIHGSVEGRSVVPPTWSKGGLSGSSAWRLALAQLAKANHIRILGYSLPESDLNVRYLLKAAARHSFNLKSVHVVCLDPDKEVKRRYDALFDFDGYDFKTDDISRYLQRVAQSAEAHPEQSCATALEFVHADLFGQPKR